MKYRSRVQQHKQLHKCPEANGYKNTAELKSTVPLITTISVYMFALVPAASQDISSVMDCCIINQPGLDLSVEQGGCSPRLLQLRRAPK